METEQQRLKLQIQARQKAEQNKEFLISQLQEALEKVKVLRGVILICSKCHKIRDDEGFWNQMEEYIQKHSNAEFSHGICPDCAHESYPGFSSKK